MAGAGITVRRAGLEDLDGLARLFDAYRQFYHQPSDPVGARAFLEARMVAGESVALIAVMEDGRVAGFTQLYPLFSSTRMARLWLLNDLFVVAEYRRTGVADALMAAAEAHARDDGAAAIVLETTEDNAGAQALYERRGWALEQGIRHYYKTLESP